MLREALAFARGRDDGIRVLLLGGLFVLTAWLVLPALLVAGYLLSVMDVGARGRDRLPPFGNWQRLLVDGLRATVVTLVYGLGPVVVLVGGVLVTWWLVLPTTGPAIVLDEGAGAFQQLPVEALGLVGLVAFVLLLAAVVFWLHLPAALVALGTQGTLGAAFQSDALWTVVNTTAYLKGVVLAGVLFVFGMTVAIPLSAILVGFVLQFYVLVAVAFVMGRAVGGGAVTAIKPAE